MRNCTAPAGMPEPSDRTRPARQRDVTDGDVHDRPVPPAAVGGASMKQVMAKPWSLRGIRTTTAAARFSPPALPCTWVRGSASPSVMSSLVSVEGTHPGRWSYGPGGRWRVSFHASSLCRPEPAILGLVRWAGDGRNTSWTTSTDYLRSTANRSRRSGLWPPTRSPAGRGDR